MFSNVKISVRISFKVQKQYTEIIRLKVFRVQLFVQKKKKVIHFTLMSCNK